MKRLMYVLFFVLLTSGMAYAQQAKYVFYFIGDGMGVNQVNGTEMYLAEQEGRIGVKPLLFTSFPVASMATTFSATNSVTDSSAAGTALATGAKTYNGAIGMDDNKSVLQSVAERAKKSGKKVGVTTSVSVDHATPAAFYAHQPDRGTQGNSQIGRLPLRRFMMSNWFTVMDLSKLLVISTCTLPIMRIKGISNLFSAGAGNTVCFWA